MAKKSYFTNKKKVKKYQFAGIDTEVNNTGYLNAMYNPNYYGEQAFNEQAVQSGKTAAIANARSGSESYAEKKANFENKQLEAKMNFAAATQQKDAELQQNLTQTQNQELAKVPVESFTSKLIDISKAFKPAASTVASTVATSVSPIGLQPLPKLSLPSPKTPGLNMFNNQTISLGKKSTSVMAPVGQAQGTQIAEAAGKQGLKSTLGSTAWQSAKAANIAGGAGLALSIGGQLWDTLSEDSNPYEYSKKEKWGDWGGNLLSSIGTYGGLGSAFGPLGTLVGGVVGAGVGTFKAIKEGKKNKKMAAELNAQKAQEEAMYQQQQDLYNQELSKQKAIYDYNRQKYRESSLMADEMLRQARLKGLTTSEFQGNMAQTGGVKKYLSGGANAKRIPGGMVVPVPGANNAVEYIGNKHSEKKIDNVSGIRPDSKTEVEDGEIKAPVTQANGYPAEYYFSSYLKYGGIPIATHFKNIIKNGGTQKDIQDLARIQEAIANKKGEKDRSPNTIAPPTYISKLGGIRKYKTGGVSEDPPNMTKEQWNKLSKEDKYSYIYIIAKNLGDKFPELTASQWALESGFGNQTTGSWNMFGQTATAWQKGANLNTPRDPGGGGKKFRSYDSIEASVKDHLRIWLPLYKDAKDVEQAVKIIQNLEPSPNNPEGKRYASGYPTPEHPKGNPNAYVKSILDITKQYTPLLNPKIVGNNIHEGINPTDYMKDGRWYPGKTPESVEQFPLEEIILPLRGLGRNIWNAGKGLADDVYDATIGKNETGPKVTRIKTKPGDWKYPNEKVATVPKPQIIGKKVGPYTGNIEPGINYGTIGDALGLHSGKTPLGLPAGKTTLPKPPFRGPMPINPGGYEEIVDPNAPKETIEDGSSVPPDKIESKEGELPVNTTLPPLSSIDLPTIERPAAPEKLVPKSSPTLTNAPKLPKFTPALSTFGPAKSKFNYYLPMAIGAAGQVAGTLGALSKLNNIPYQDAPGYNVPMIPNISFAPSAPPIGSIPQVNLPRVNYNQDRTDSDNRFTAVKNFIQSNTAGPEAIAMVLKSQRNADDTALKISQKEVEANNDIKQREALTNADISKANIQNVNNAYQAYTQGLISNQELNSRISQANQAAMQNKFNYDLERNKLKNEFNYIKQVNQAGALEKLGTGVSDMAVNFANLYSNQKLAEDLLAGTPLYERYFGQTGGVRKYIPNRLGDLKNRKLIAKK